MLFMLNKWPSGGACVAWEMPWLSFARLSIALSGTSWLDLKEESGRVVAQSLPSLLRSSRELSCFCSKKVGSDGVRVVWVSPICSAASEDSLVGPPLIQSYMKQEPSCNKRAQ